MDSNAPRLNIVVVGESKVGKSCLLKQYCESRFDANSQPNFGCDFFTPTLTSTVSGKKVRLVIIDNPGQERFNNITKIMVRKASGCVVVSDIQDQNTLQETLKWKNMVEVENSGRIDGLCIPFMLVQNKCDTIFDGERQDFQQPQFLENFARQNGFLGSIQTSAKTRVGVEELFKKLIQEIDDQGLIPAQQQTFYSKLATKVKTLFGNPYFAG